MLGSFRHKGLSQLWETGKTAKIDVRLQGRILERLDALDAAMQPEDMNIPGYDFHALRGFTATRYTVHVIGPWCVTFEFLGPDAMKVDLEQYH